MKAPCFVFSRLPCLLSTFSASNFYHTFTPLENSLSHLQEPSSFLPPPARFCHSGRLRSQTGKTAETHYARAFSRQRFASQVWLAGFSPSLTGSLRRCNSRDKCCRQSAGAAAGSWRAFLAAVGASVPVLFRAAGQSIMTSALENYINRILGPAAAGYKPRPWRSPRPHWTGLVLERPGAGVGGRLGCPATAGPGLRVDEGLQNEGPASPAPGAGARRSWGPKAPFNFNLKQNKTEQCDYYELFPFSIEISSLFLCTTVGPVRSRLGIRSTVVLAVRRVLQSKNLFYS